MDKLFVPGPVDVEQDVMKQMQRPMIYHRGKDFSQMLENCVEKLKNIMYTKNYVFISTSSSTGLMEAAIRNCVFIRSDSGNLRYLCGVPAIAKFPTASEDA